MSGWANQTDSVAMCHFAMCKKQTEQGRKLFLSITFMIHIE